MTPVFTARRRADEFEALVSGASLGTPQEQRYAPLLELAEALRAVPEVAPRPEFVADLRQRLLAEADTALAPVDTSRLALPARRPRRDRRIAAAVSGLALVGATTSMAMAAQSALPGDSLYPIKRVIENAHTQISLGDADKGETLLDNATGRLDEVDALTRADGPGDRLAVADTLDAFTDQATEASDLLLADYADTGHESSVAELRQFTVESIASLASLEPQVPVDAHDELLHAAGVLRQIDADVTRACPECAAGITSLPAQLLPAAFQPPAVLGHPPAKAAGTGKAGPRHQHAGPPDTPGELPVVDPGQLAPGSVTQPSAGSTPASNDGPAPAPGSGASGPLQGLADGVTGTLQGGGGSQPTSNPVGETIEQLIEGVDGPLDGAVGGVGGAVGGLTGPVTGQQPLP